MCRDTAKRVYTNPRARIEMDHHSRVQKGKRYEKHLAALIVESGLDPNAGREIGSGSGLRKGDLRARIDFLVEAKNEANVSKALLLNIDQAKDQARKGWKWPERWALVFRDPREPETKSDDYVVLDFNEFLELLKRAAEPRTKGENPDRAFRYALDRLVTSIKGVKPYLPKE